MKIAKSISNVNSKSKLYQPVFTLLRCLLVVSLVFGTVGSMGVRGQDVGALNLSLEPLIADENFSFGGDFGEQDIARFFQEHLPQLYDATVRMGALDMSPAQALYASTKTEFDYSVNPKIILTILTMQSHSHSGEVTISLNDPFKFDNETGEHYSDQLVTLSHMMVIAYKDFEQGNRHTLTFRDGTELAASSNLNAGSFAVYAGLAWIAKSQVEFAEMVENTQEGFTATYTDLFESPLIVNYSTNSSQVSVQAPFLYKPFAGNKSVNAWFDHDMKTAQKLRFDGNSNMSYNNHGGIDFGLSQGENYLASADGIVDVVYVDAGTEQEKQSCLAKPLDDIRWSPYTAMIIKHKDGYVTGYWHLQRNSIGINPRTGRPFKEDEVIQRGEIVGKSGDTGCVTGPHAHFFVQLNGKSVDPYGWCGKGNDPNSPASIRLWAESPGGAEPCPADAQSDQPPVITVDSANEFKPINQEIKTNRKDWSFSGTAKDDKGVMRVKLIINGSETNETANSSNGWLNWNYSGLLNGQNKIQFRAYDNRINGGNYTDSGNWVTILVDAATPTTNYQLYGTSGQNSWYRSPVQVTLSADDVGSGNWSAGIKTIHYNVDGVPHSPVDRPIASFTISNEGTHTIEYSATDMVDNQGITKPITVKIDATPPSAPGTPTMNGVTFGVWQKIINDPSFTWAPSSDGSGSGVIGYIADWDGATYNLASPAFDPPAVRTGSHTLRIKAVDAAGNLSAASQPLIFNYDGDPPKPPAVQNNDNIANGVWQNRIRTVNFTWPPAEDGAGSGVQKYYVYAGNDPNGTSAAPTTSRGYVNATPFVAADGAATFYLRTRSEDGVGLQSDWNSYAIRYDGAPPTVTLNANYGLPVAHSTNVNLNVATDDLGSGVDQMRFSVEGSNWSEWQSAANNILWQIPSVGKRSYDIYTQVKDRAGNLSAIVSDTVTLNVNSPFPQSANFFLWNGEFVGGSTDNNGGILTSPSWKQRVTLGLNFGATTDTTNRSSSTNYRLNSGYQAAALGIPTATVTNTTYLLLNHTLSSGGSGSERLISSNWKMDGTVGQATNIQTTRSSNFAATLGYWGTVAMITDTLPPPPPPVTSTTPIDCEFYSLSVNKAALYTNSPAVTVDLCGPNPTEIMLSNDGGFGGATWQPYTRTVPWAMTTYGAYVLPRTVYARYRDAQGQIFGPIQDDIIYDPTPPSGRSSFNITSLFAPAVTFERATVTDAGVDAPQIVDEVRTVSTATQEMYLVAGDDASGLTEMQVSLAPDFANANWQPYNGIVPVTLPEDGAHTVYTRFRDNAGNVSTATTAPIVRDTTPPTGTVTMIPAIVSANQLTVTLHFSATDNVSGVSLVRASRFATFSDTVWLPYTPELVFNLNDDGAVTPVLYAQFRDAAGNESPVSQYNYQVDSIAPTANISVTDFSESKITLQFNAQDDLSGLKEVWLSFDYEFITGVVKLNYVPTLEWDMQGYGVVNMRFVDNVGNISEGYWWGGSDGPIDDIPEEIENRVYLPVISRY